MPPNPRMHVSDRRQLVLVTCNNLMIFLATYNMKIRTRNLGVDYLSRLAIFTSSGEIAFNDRPLQIKLIRTVFGCICDSKLLCDFSENLVFPAHKDNCIGRKVFDGFPQTLHIIASNASINRQAKCLGERCDGLDRSPGVLVIEGE
mmetsp:Transcript_29941/g.72933  ORF Transcript_29941/g.72933 Transcript_29941/m.72933 type:complete len:146 (+) Transcript_29941:113-550(+)